MLTLFFAVHVVVTALLIHVLGVAEPRYCWIPWIFAAAGMLSLPPPVRRRLVSGGLLWRLLPAVLYAGVISLASSVNPRPAAGVSGSVFHPFEYAGLAFLAQYALHCGFARPLSFSRVAVTAAACVVFGAVDELHQSMVPGRCAAATDAGLDAVGVVLGSLVYVGTTTLVRRRNSSKPDTRHS